jgi:hypothetical protein
MGEDDAMWPKAEGRLLGTRLKKTDASNAKRNGRARPLSMASPLPILTYVRTAGLHLRHGTEVPPPDEKMTCLYDVASRRSTEHL